MKSTHSQAGAIGAPVIIGIGAVILIVIAAGYFYLQNTATTPGSDLTMPPDDAMMMEDEGLMEELADSMLKDDDAMMAETATTPATGTTTSYSGEVLAGTSAPLLVFNQADYDKAVAEGKLVVLYFYANWCPICRAEFPLAEAAFNQLTGSDVVGFQVSFNDNETDDTEVALAREFGVPYQHTKVFVKNGQQVLKSPEQWTTARYLSEINSHR